jgi:hypothetical protein
VSEGDFLSVMTTRLQRNKEPRENVGKESPRENPRERDRERPTREKEKEKEKDREREREVVQQKPERGRDRDMPAADPATSTPTIDRKSSPSAPSVISPVAADPFAEQSSAEK